MLISVEWLRDHLDLTDQDPEQLGELITLHIAEVNEIRNPALQWEGIRVAILTLIVHYWGVDPLKTALHEISRMAVFGIVLADLFSIADREHLRTTPA